MSSKSVSTRGTWYSATGTGAGRGVSATLSRPASTQPAASGELRSRLQVGAAGGYGSSGYAASMSSRGSGYRSDNRSPGASVRGSVSSGYAASASSSATLSLVRYAGDALSRSASDLGGSSAGSWRRTFAMSSQRSNAEAPTSAPGGEPGARSTPSSTATMFSAHSHASWLLPQSNGAGGFGHLDLSGRSMSSLPPEAAASHGGPPSSGSVLSLSSIPSELPNLEPDTPELSQPVPAAPSASSNGAWSFWAHLEEQGTASSRPATQRSGGMAPAGPTGAQEAPAPSRGDSEILLASNPSSPASGRPFPDDLSGRTQGAASEPASLPPAQTKGQTDGQWARSRIESAYEAAERTVHFDFQSHATFRSSYNELKNAMSEAGSMQTYRLAGLLGREEEEIRSHYGRTKWQSLNMDLDVDPGWDAAKRFARNSQLQWIKHERASLRSLAPVDEGANSSAAAAPSRSRLSGVSRLSQRARSSLRPASTGPAASRRPLAPISEDHEVRKFSGDYRAAEARAEPVAAASTRSGRSGISRWASKHLVPKSVRLRFGR